MLTFLPRLFWPVFILNVLVLLWAFTRLHTTVPDSYSRLFLAVVILCLALANAAGLGLYLMVRTPGFRTLAAVLLLAPLLLTGARLLLHEARDQADLRDREGLNRFTGPQAALAKAIYHSNAAEVTRLATRELVLQPAKDGYTLFEHAMSELNIRGPEHAEVIATIVRAGADPNAPLLSGELPLERACPNFTEFTNVLLQNGADPNRVGKDGNPAYFCALTTYNHDWTDRLVLHLQHGADPNALAANGRTAAAVSILQGNPRTFALLLQHGASLDRKGTDGLSAREHWTRQLHTEFQGTVPAQSEWEQIEKLLRPSRQKSRP